MVNNPTGNTGLTANLLPDFYQTPANKKFLQATLDQLYQPGSVNKISGYIGKENSKASTGKDIFISAADANRQHYQLEPGATVTDSLGNITFFKDYLDFINQLNVFGANTTNHARVNEQEFYSWDPHIDWDKLVNFQNYYWLPYGPEPIRIYGQAQTIISTYTVQLQSNGNDNQYVFTPDGFTPNPILKLYRGQTYHFEISSSGNPFSFKLSRATGTTDRYVTDNINNYGIEKGTITFTVPLDSPDIIYYQSESDINLGGAIEIYNIDENTYINIEADILGKKTYQLSNGTTLSNGMKVTFGGNVTPSNYATGAFYVEGVGNAIRLVPENILEIVSPYTVSESIQFDNTPFDKEPFSDATGYASISDYIVIDRASQDHNPWSRYNRWFHKDVITTSAIYNNTIPSIDQTTRAIRPIVEFHADLKLFNFGTTAIPDVDLIDDFTTDVFSTIEGSAGCIIDGVALSQGQRILFTADTDPLVQNKIYQVEFIDVLHLNSGSPQIHLVEAETPKIDQVVLIKNGIKNQSLMYWFDGTAWVKGQQKTNTNQPPLFDVVDANGTSFGNLSTYSGSSFVGTKLFSYKVGTGVADATLGFPLSYKNVSNIGDIVFNFDLITDSFQYKKSTAIVSEQINTGFLVTHDYAGNLIYENGWKTSLATTTQAALRIYKNSNKTNNFDIDIFDNLNNLNDLVVRVYVNGTRLPASDWSLISTPVYKQVVLKSDIALTDILTIRAFSAQPINANGYYEIPINLQNNPLNNTMGDFTLGEVIDHVNSIVDNLTNFVGAFPGASNLRDLGNITPYGTKFVQHSGPASLSLYHITNESNNVIRAIEQAREDYNNFKRTFIAIAGDLGIDGDPVFLVDLILEKISKDKPKTAPYYFSDMIPYGASLKTDLSVVDFRIKNYPLTTPFSLTELSNKAVGVYHNGVQLVYGRDYNFNSQGFVVIAPTVNLTNGDTITTYEYESTDGSFVPATPTKFGMWPCYEPRIYTDTTVNIPEGQLMIQGHDGSQILAYGDYRDQLILELEKRIFNNIKVEYDPTIFDITNIIPSYNRTNAYSLEEFNTVLAPSFYKWAKLVGIDFTKSINYDINNSFTYNYSYNSAPDNTSLPGYWRGVYRWLLDTDRPHICPWEMLGFNIEPTWWTSVYGPAPYTSDNLVMWQDITDGIVRNPNTPPVKLSKFAKPFLISNLPVDEQGNLLSPVQSGLSRGTIAPSSNLDFVFGDVAPVEAAWRRSSHYSFSVLITSLLLTPSKTLGLLLDRSRIQRNLAGQLIYKDTGLRIRPTDIVLPSIYSSNTRVQTAGIINYVVDLILNYIFSNNIKSYNTYATDLATINFQLSYRLGAFTNKNQFNLLLDSKTPSSTGSVFIPAEDYSVILNSSNPVNKLTYSGVIITKQTGGYQISGYSQTQPYFKYYPYIQSGTSINVGGISESFTTWTAGQQYTIGSIVKYNGSYFRTTATNTSATFDNSYFAVLPALPVNGGVNAVLRKVWDRTSELVVPYGTEFTTIQAVVDFLQGYGEWLKDQGFEFNEFNTNLGQVSNWETSAKEFLFWTTQNWSTGQDKWSDWLPSQPVSYGSIVRYNGYYYSANRNLPASSVFNYDDYTKLDGLSNVGSSVISLSPSAGKINFNAPLSVVDDINNLFNTYEIFKVDGTAIQPADLDSYRNENTVSYSPRTADGIYGASFYLIQHEHVVIINNTTIFNDVIYNPESGYRQERIKVSAYVTPDWYGGLDIPGFVFDQAIVKSWQQWTDYNMGDIIVYQGYYYSANKFLPGTTTFVASDWTQLANKPTPQILPNWTNLATQFQDFYSLDTDSFDLQQQTMGQHLIGYQKRQYLDNIIQDDVSEFKFYQGMIREKGTQNVLNKLFDVLSSDNLESLSFYEEWALRVGQYGASTAFQQIEFILNDGDIKNNPQGYDLVQQKDLSINSFIIQQTPTDVYLKPTGYNSSPWPIATTYQPLLRNAGHVNSGDVDIIIGNISDITSQDPSKLINGSYIWCTFDTPPFYWNVYRFTDIGITVVGVAYDATAKTLTFTTEKLVTFAVNSYIGITQTTNINGFYKIISVSLNSFVVSATVPKWVQPFPNLSSITVYTLISQRTTTIDLLDNISPSRLKNKELIWTDNIQIDDGIWATWTYESAYSQANILNTTPSAGLTYGRTIAVSNTGTISAISTSDGKTLVYAKSGILVPWIKHQAISNPAISANTFPGVNLNSPNVSANVIAISNDNTWLATGSPLAGYAATRLVQDVVHGSAFIAGTSYPGGAIVSSSGIYYQAPTVSKISNFGTISLVTPVNALLDATGPWVVTINQLDNTAGLAVNGTFVANDGTGSLFGNYPTNVTIQSIDSNTSITCLVTGGSKPTIGTIANVTTKISNIQSTYTVSGITSTQGQGARFTIVVIGASYTINVVSGGAGYKVGNKIKILGSQVGGLDTVNDITITVTGTPPQQDSIQTISWSGITPDRTYTSLPGNIILGSGATFNVTPILSGYIISVNNGGSGYVVGDNIRISGAALGGDNVLNDLLIKIDSVNNINTGTITVASIVTGITSWTALPYVPVDITGTNNNLSKHGVISLYKKDANNEYILVDTILSPTPTANEQFGSTLTFGNNVLYVGAIGYNNNKGIVYKFKYTTITNVSTSYNPVGSHNAVISVTSTLGIRPGMYVVGTGFTSNQYVTSIIDETTLALSGSPNSTPSGVLSFVTTRFVYDSSEIFTGSVNGENFGSAVSLSGDGNTLLISNAGGVTVGKIFVYKKTGTAFSTTPSQTLVGIDNNFGKSIAISDSGTYIAVSDDIKSTTKVNQQGVVGVYKYTSNSYSFYQELVDHYPEVQGRFGNKIAFMNDYETLVVYSQAGDTTTTTTFNTNGITTFDKDSTQFLTTQVNTGRVDVYDMYATKWVFSETLPTSNTVSDGYGVGFAVGANQIFVGAPYAQDRNLKSGKIYNYSKMPGTYSWTVTNKRIDIPDISKVKKAFLYNRATGNLIKYLDVIDPLQGKIPGPAEEEIKYKTFYDPAVYSTGTSAVVVDSSNAWSKQQVGTLWWNLTTTKFVNAYDQDIIYRNSNWNTLAVGASVDIYEWVSSNLKPSQWDAQADTVAGIAVGISGTSLYGDSVYSTRQNYDKISKAFKNTYYFWVKNKKIVPQVPGRNMSAQDVSNLIANPRGQDYAYLALTGLNTFSLANIKPFLNSSNVVLSVEYWTIDKTDQNVHSQWKIISNDPTITLPSVIEQKWIDSLCGADESGRLVPDPLLPVKIRYGVENRPRQGMFVNRFEALKEFIEYTNQILLENRIVENSDLSKLNQYDAEPNIIQGLYDTVLDTDAELKYTNTTSFVMPEITPEVDANGKVTGIKIVSSGKGYVVAPYITIVGPGQGAVVKSIINSQGQIIGATVVSAGEGYIAGETICQVRSYSVLVHSDGQAEGNWSVYTYDTVYKLWSRTLTQSYDVRKYWTYVDWYATGYNQFTLADYAVNTFADLNTIEPSIGNTVKIRTANAGGWLLLEKYADSTSVDWTLSYSVIGIQNGTIQLDSSLYEFVGTNVGYDSSIFDGDAFDIVASTELRIILKTIKTNIFISNLKQEYLNLFFNSIRYVFSEQVYVDWIFKTSFVKAQHNVGALSQPVNYPVDNLSNFEDYVAEVKPYRTKIREYVSNYESMDTAEMPVTDFDLQPIYENNKIVLVNTTVKDGKIQADDYHIQNYPWKFWLDNVGFQVTELVLTSGGSGYLTEPTVRFISDSGNGATARAFFTNGTVNRIVLLTPGSGYLSAPEVVIDGGISSTGVAATASAIIGNSVIRSTRIGIKFDRITQTNYITQLQQVETFSGTGSALQFKLKWSPDITIGRSTVVVNGIPVLRELYNLTTITSTSNGYTQYSGLLSFVVGNAPATGSTIVITYYINDAILNAADRINYFYNPGEGDLGKDLAQLMTGIDYGGVIVDGLGFDVPKGWGSSPYFSDKWSPNTAFDDYFVTVHANTWSFTLPYTPDVGTEINIYHIKNNTDSYVSNGTQVEYNYNPLAISPVATTITTVSSSGIQTTYNSSGSFDTTLKVTNTAGIVIGMGIFGVGFATERHVVSIPDSTTVIIDKVSDSTPSGTLTFTFNQAGSNQLTLTSTANIHVGDLVSTSASNSFVYDTQVIQIVNSTTIKISTIVYADIPYGSDIKFTRTLVQPNDLTINANGTLLLTAPVTQGSILNITGKINPIRLDDPAYGTPDQKNKNAIVPTFVADGESATFTIPNTYTVNEGDEFILRKTTSDGSIPTAETDYDTALTGGDWAYTTATGLLADDIIVDGDGFVTPTSSPAPEEVVPGQVVDSVSIKVYDRPITGSANIKVDNFIADGIAQSYVMTQQPNSQRAVVVKVNNLVKTYSDDYSIDYRTRTIRLNSVPAKGDVISIFNIGFNGSNILDLDYFIGDGVTTEFITKAPWLSSFTSLVYIDGVITSPVLFKTDSTYEFSNAVGIRFQIPPNAGSLVNFIIVSGKQQTFAITKTELVPTDGSLTYNLNYPIGTSLPNESNMIVRVDQSILQGPNNNYFVIGKNKLNYAIDPAKISPYTAAIDQILVFVDGVQLTLGSDYTVDIGGISIKISKVIYTKYTGKNLLVSITTNESYFYNPSTQQITFTQAYDNTHTVEVISSYNHSVLDIERTTVNVTANAVLTPNTFEFYYYKQILSGLIKLDRPVIDDNYVWVVKNSTLLTPSIDYRVNDDKISIQLLVPPNPTDEITLITFGSNVLTTGIAYQQFKDMLNRVHFKRLSLNKQTTLAQDLHWNDTSIVLVDASNFDVPNPSKNLPGVIEIRGERIEYFAIQGNTLSKLRRGTLGTGVYNLHRAGSFVQDIGPTETIPYTETTITEQIISNGTNIVNLGFVPTKSKDLWIYPNGFTSGIPAGYGQSNDIEVFAGGIRLKKKPYKLFNVNQAPYSPSGDVQFDAEFAVDGISKQLRLTNTVNSGIQITVVKRNGIAWDSSLNIQNDNTKIAQFLKASPGIWYSDYKS